MLHLPLHPGALAARQLSPSGVRRLRGIRRSQCLSRVPHRLPSGEGNGQGVCGTCGIVNAPLRVWHGSASLGGRGPHVREHTEAKEARRCLASKLAETSSCSQQVDFCVPSVPGAEPDDTGPHGALRALSRQQRAGTSRSCVPHLPLDALGRSLIRLQGLSFASPLAAPMRLHGPHRLRSR